MFLPRISARIATTCDTILNFPSGDAGITTPRACAMLRSTVTANLAAENHHHHPGRRQVHLHERHERRGDQQLVGQRIHDLPERGDLLAAARQVAVEPVGQRRQAEDRRADQLLPHAQNEAPLELRQQHDDQQRHEKDAAERQRVRQIHQDRHASSIKNQHSAIAMDYHRNCMKAILLAGGKGTRLRPLTVHTPKPIVPILNRPFLYYQIDLLRQVPEIDEVILSLNYQPRRIEEIFGEGEGLGLRVRYVVEPMPLGTGGAVRYAGDSLTESVVVFNGDVLTQVDLGGGAAAAPRAQGEGDDRADAGREPARLRAGRDRRRTRNIQRFLEKPGEDEITCNTINAGIYVLEPDTFDRIPEGHGLVDRAQLLPVAHRARRDVRRLRLRRLLDRHRHAGEVPAGPPRHHGWPLSGRAVRRGAASDLLVSPDAKVEQGVELHGPCFIDEGAVVKAGARSPSLLGDRPADPRRRRRGHRRLDHLAERLDRPRRRRPRRRSSAATATSAATRPSIPRCVLGDKTVITDYSKL